MPAQLVLPGREQTLCPAGSSSAMALASSAEACEACAPGQYGEGCVACPENSWTVGEGSTSIEDCVCKDGPAGQLRYDQGVAARRCRAHAHAGRNSTRLPPQTGIALAPPLDVAWPCCCEQGERCAVACRGAQGAQPLESARYFSEGAECALCPLNSYCQGGTRTAARGKHAHKPSVPDPTCAGGSRTVCPTGTWSAVPMASSAEACEACAPGRYGVGCVACPTSSWTVGEGSTSIEDCVCIDGSAGQVRYDQGDRCSQVQAAHTRTSRGQERSRRKRLPILWSSA